jgi:glutamate-1-semialdehyde 2,1-aminomutase
MFAISGYEVYCGSEEDVLERYYLAAKEYGADVVVRITGDCPLIDPEVVDAVIRKFASSGADYASNAEPATYPDGLDAEVFSAKALETAWSCASSAFEREHVTPFLCESSQFSRESYVNCIR